MKLIEKILDNYYIKKLKLKIEKELLLYFIDLKFEEKENYISLLIKKRKYNDKQYQELLSFYKEDAFIYLFM